MLSGYDESDATVRCSVAIVGAGIGGLALAAGIRPRLRTGWHVATASWRSWRSSTSRRRSRTTPSGPP